MSTRVKSLSLLALLGLIWGSGYSLARFATTHGVNPLGYSFWQSLGPAVLLTLLSIIQHKGITFSLRRIGFYVVCGAIGIALPNTNMYVVAPHVPAGLLAVVVNTIPIMTYVLALLSRSETFHKWRFVGILFAVFGIAILVLPTAGVAEFGAMPWLLRALFTPLCFASSAIFISKYRPSDCSAMQLAAGMLAMSALLLTPVVFGNHQFHPLLPPLTPGDWAVVIEMILTSISYVIFFKLIKIAGPVYYSLVGGIVALTGLFWGWVVFNETLTLITAGAVSLIIVAIALVTAFQNQHAS